MLKNQRTFFLEYISGKTILYKINPAFKLFSLIILCLFLGINNLFFNLIAFLIIAFVFFLLEKNIKIMFLRIWKVCVFFIFTGFVKFLTSGSIENGIIFCLKLIFMTIAGSIFYITTRLYSLRIILSKFFSKKISVLFIMMLAFIPIIFQSFCKQEEARYSRNFKVGKNIFISIKKISMPLLVDMFIKSEEMADAWYSRGYAVDFDKRVP